MFNVVVLAALRFAAPEDALAMGTGTVVPVLAVVIMVALRISALILS